ncbi:viral replication factor C subunit [Microbacterium sp. HM58-2]|nr:viral replication factor C subunit [Microbacterium sp. HM58-2]
MLLNLLTIAGSCWIIGTLTTERGVYIDPVPRELTPLEQVLQALFFLGIPLLIAAVILLSGLPRHPLSRNLCILAGCMWALGGLWLLTQVALLL